MDNNYSQVLERKTQAPRGAQADSPRAQCPIWLQLSPPPEMQAVKDFLVSTDNFTWVLSIPQKEST